MEGTGQSSNHFDSRNRDHNATPFLKKEFSLMITNQTILAQKQEKKYRDKTNRG